jgi:hypothetical protein
LTLVLFGCALLSIDGVWAAWDGSDEEFQAAYKASRAVVRTFTAVGETVGKPANRR